MENTTLWKISKQLLILVSMASVIYGCPPGRFRDRKDGLCHKCHPCLRTLVPIKNCTATSDTVCACRKGTYFDFSKQSCITCSKCRRHHDVIEKCRHDQDTVCTSCPKGSFLNATRCVPCKRCNNVRLACSHLSDTICMEPPTRDFTTPTCGNAVGAGCTSVDHTSEQKSYNIHIIVGVLASVVLLSLLLLFICCKRRKKGEKSDPDAKDKRVSVVTEASNLTLTMENSDSGYTKIPFGKKIDMPWVTSIDDVNGTSSRLLPKGCIAKKIEDLTQRIKDELCVLLLPSSCPIRGWKTLADEVGFSRALITFMDCNKREDPVAALLDRMTTAPGHRATVLYLYESLAKIGRHDVCKLLQGELYVQSEDIEMV